jgi:hypothetical protein
MAEETNSPITAAVPPKASPLGSPVAPKTATIKLKPVIRKPALGGVAPLSGGVKASTVATSNKATTSAIEQLKSVTAQLKGVTQQIPEQAILHKTGIISDQSELTQAQRDAAKARTARISLSDAIGAAPVKSDPPPMKTIRIKRPVDLPTNSFPPTSRPQESAPVQAAEAPQTAAAPQGTTVTQRKTLKIARPGAVRPAGKFSLKKQDSASDNNGDKALTQRTTLKVARPATKAPVAASQDGDVPEIGDIADIPDIPAQSAKAFAPAALQKDPDAVPRGYSIFCLLIEVAACVVMGVLTYFLYKNTETPMF